LLVIPEHFFQLAFFLLQQLLQQLLVARIRWLGASNLQAVVNVQSILVDSFAAFIKQPSAIFIPPEAPESGRDVGLKTVLRHNPSHPG
jgi:hypothetical protein